MSTDSIPIPSSPLIIPFCLLPTSRDKCIYTSHYCEENIYQLCKTLHEQIKRFDIQEIGNDTCTCEYELYTCFLSNANNVVVISQQSNGDSSDDYTVCWDYHVIAIAKQINQCIYCKKQQSSESIEMKTLVYDFDTKLSFPTIIQQYIPLSFCPHIILRPRFYRQFRVIGAIEYINSFACDRSHMIDPTAQTLTYYKPPPTYPCIINMNGETMNLDAFRHMPKSNIKPVIIMDDTTEITDKNASNYDSNMDLYRYGQLYSLTQFIQFFISTPNAISCARTH